MKKLLMFLILTFTLLGCGTKEEDYIKAVQNITLYEVIELRGYPMIVTTEDLAAFYISKLTDEKFTEVKKGMTYKIIEKPSKNSRIIEASKSGAVVIIPVKKVRDYFEINPADMQGKFGEKKYNSQNFEIEIVKQRALNTLLGF